MDAREIKDLLKYVRSAGFHEVELEMEGLRLRVVRDCPANGAVMPAVAAPAPAQAVVPPAPGARIVAASTPGLEEGVVEQKSPMVGTFYRAASPGADVFVSVGDRVEPGQTLCILEAMKLMNEIEAEVAGTIVEILPDNAQPVEFGEVLFRIRTRD
jgi:acetyl-CoA carboxylase biotin carboxyl carrier protein